MRIVNGLETTALTNIGVNVKFSDRDGNGVRATSNPDDTSALFLVREVLLLGVDGGVQGAGMIQPKTTGGSVLADHSFGGSRWRNCGGRDLMPWVRP